MGSLFFEVWTINNHAISARLQILGFIELVDLGLVSFQQRLFDAKGGFRKIRDISHRHLRRTFVVLRSIFLSLCLLFLLNSLRLEGLFGNIRGQPILLELFQSVFD